MDFSWNYRVGALASLVETLPVIAFPFLPFELLAQRYDVYGVNDVDKGIANVAKVLKVYG